MWSEGQLRQLKSAARPALGVGVFCALGGMYGGFAVAEIAYSALVGSCAVFFASEFCQRRQEPPMAMLPWRSRFYSRSVFLLPYTVMGLAATALSSTKNVREAAHHFSTFSFVVMIGLMAGVAIVGTVPGRWFDPRRLRRFRRS